MSVIAALSACGGGGSDPIQEPFSLVDEAGTATVVLLNSGTLSTSEVEGEWDGDDQVLSISGQELAATTGSLINDTNSFVRQISGGSEGESLVYSATNADDLPSGTADYLGSASVVISDGTITSAAYSLTGDGLASVNFDEGTLDLTISELSGSRTTSASGPQDFTSDGTINIADLEVLSSGSIEAGDDTLTTITGVDAVAVAADATVSATGGIAGPAGEEIAGVAAVSDADTILLTTFSGVR